jgi:putative membrane protein
VSEGTEPEWERLHPASVLVNLVPRTWSLLRNLWPLLLALWFGGRSQAGEVIGNLSILLVFFASALGWTALHALTLRYRVADGKLEIKSGLLNRQARVISADRVQNVERVQNVFHRLSGLVEVRIETASGTEVEGMLSAIDVPAADRLIASLHPAHAARAPEAPPPEREVLVHNTLVDLAWAGASDLRLGAIGVAMAVFVEFVPQMGGEEIGWLAHIPGLAWGALAVALVSGGWLVGIGSSVLRSYGFELSLSERRLVAVQGLLTRRRTELGLSKVQLLSFVEPLLLRQVGLGSLQIETAAAPTGGSGTERGEVFVPILERDRVAALSRVALPLGELDPATVKLHPPHPFAATRAMGRAAVRTVGLSLLLVWMFGPAGALGLLLVPVAVATAWLDVAHQGWLVTDALVIARRGVITRTTWLLSRKKLQSAVLSQGPVLAWRGVGLLSLRVAGSRVDLPLLDHAEARRLQRVLLGVPEEQDPAP